MPWRMRAEGLRVFKLQVNGKIPAVEKFYDVASADPGEVFQMWTDPVTGKSLHNNIGVLTGDGLVVIDVDVKTGSKAASLSRCSRHGPRHEHLSGPHTKRRAAPLLPHIRADQEQCDQIGHGLDVRGHHGYVVGAGSSVAAGVYTAENEHDLPHVSDLLELSAWLADMSGRANPPTKTTAYRSSISTFLRT